MKGLGSAARTDSRGCPDEPILVRRCPIPGGSTSRASPAPRDSARSRSSRCSPPQDGELESFFNVWVYDGLMVFAMRDSRLARVPRATRARSVDGHHGCAGLLDLRRALVRDLQAPDVPVDGGRGLHRVLRPAVRRGRAASPLSRAVHRRDALARRRDGGARGWQPWARPSWSSSSSRTRTGSTSTVVTNLAYPLGDVLLLSAVFGVFSLTRWRPGQRWLVLGLGILATSDGRRHLPLPVLERDVRRGHVGRHPLADGHAARGASAWLPDRTREGLEVEGRPLLAVPAVCALVATGILVYDHFMRVNVLAIVLASATLVLVIARLAITFRENRRLFELTRAEATTDASDGAREPPPAPRRPRPPACRRDRSPDAADALRPRRLQGLQRHVRAPAGDALLVRLGAKLAAVPSEDRSGLPARRRRVLPRRDRGGRRGRAAHRPCVRCALRAEARASRSEAPSAPSSCRTRRPTRARRCRRRTSASTLRSTPAAERASARWQRSLAALAIREPELEAQRADVGALAVGRRRDRSGFVATSSKSSSVRRSSTTSASSPFPTRSCTSPARSTSASGRSSASTRSSASGSFARTPALRSVAGIVRSSHENWDGTGYPGRSRGRGDPARSKDRPGLQRVRRDDLGSTLPPGAHRGRGTERADAPRGNRVRRRTSYASSSRASATSTRPSEPRSPARAYCGSGAP